ncbi:MAG: hypothetical protein JXA20_03580 [Spirochaetes bacterium]|nr:hypothetical protein [Spirochaetota bacterium]
MPSKPYIDYRFLGVHSFTDTLKEEGVEHRIFDDDLSSLYEKNPEILRKDEDTVTSGIVIRDGGMLFFTQFGLKLTKSYWAHYVFIFNHHPAVEELAAVTAELPDLAERDLEGVDLSALADTISGDTIH